MLMFMCLAYSVMALLHETEAAFENSDFTTLNRHHEFPFPSSELSSCCLSLS